MILNNDFKNTINCRTILPKRYTFIGILIIATLCLLIVNVSASISPDFIQEELEAGDCYTVQKIVEIPALPLEGDIDVIFAFDLTVSMSSILNTAKVKAGQIMNTSIASYPGVSFTFGVIP